MKANTNPRIMKILAERGFGFESASIFEAEIGLKICGDPGRVMLTSCCLETWELERAMELGVKINADSLLQLSHLLAKNYRDLGVRVDLGFGSGHHAFTTTGGPQSKFGIELSQLKSYLGNAGLPNLRRIHFHLGSGIRDPSYYKRGLDVLWNELAAERPFFEVDIGGGFHYPYRNDEEDFDFQALRKIIEEFIVKNENIHGFRPKILLEPGRWLVASGGVLLSKVTDIKEKGGTLVVGTNAGLHSFLRAALYGAYHEVVFPGKGRTGGNSALIAGNSCENTDIMPEMRSIPSDLRVGDLALILDAGAYGYVMSNNYNSRPRPLEVVIRRDGKAVLAKSFDRILNSLLS